MDTRVYTGSTGGAQSPTREEVVERRMQPGHMHNPGPITQGGDTETVNDKEPDNDADDA